MQQNPKKPDPLGLDWSDDLRALAQRKVVPLRAAPVAGLPAETEPDWHHSRKREPDALVLVIRRITCSVCASVSEAPENHLFLRDRGIFSATMQDFTMLSHLPKETKVIHQDAPFCGRCF